MNLTSRMIQVVSLLKRIGRFCRKFAALECREVCEENDELFSEIWQCLKLNSIVVPACPDIEDWWEINPAFGSGNG